MGLVKAVGQSDGHYGSSKATVTPNARPAEQRAEGETENGTMAWKAIRLNVELKARQEGPKSKKANQLIGLGAFLNGAPGAIRTPDPLVRSQVLYPTELRARCQSRALYGHPPGLQGFC